jgi:hypothetical protein
MAVIEVIDSNGRNISLGTVNTSQNSLLSCFTNYAKICRWNLSFGWVFYLQFFKVCRHKHFLECWYAYIFSINHTDKTYLLHSRKFFWKPITFSLIVKVTLHSLYCLFYIIYGLYCKASQRILTLLALFVSSN